MATLVIACGTASPKSSQRATKELLKMALTWENSTDLNFPSLASMPTPTFLPSPETEICYYSPLGGPFTLNAHLA